LPDLEERAAASARITAIDIHETQTDGTGHQPMTAKRTLHVFAILLAMAVGARGQQPGQPVSPDEGRRFVAQLKLEQNADEILFASTGLDRSDQLMQAVVKAGQDGNATLDDWANYHRAMAGRAELAVKRGSIFQATFYLTLNEAQYSGVESDYEAALKSATQLLDFEKAHSITGSYSLAYRTIGEDLRKLGRSRDALDALREAKRLASDSSAPLPAQANMQTWYGTLWLELVETEIEAGDLNAASAEANQFLAAAESATQATRAVALMASADVMVAQRDYSAALDTVKKARALVPDKDPLSSVNLEASRVVGAVVQETLGPLEYAEAISTAKRMGDEFGDLIAVEPLARASILVRRRLGGDLDGTLRQLTEELAQYRAADDKGSQIEVLEELAATYQGSNSVDNQIAALEEALGLTRSLLPADGLPDNSAITLIYFSALSSLGSAYAETHRVSQADAVFQGLSQKLNGLRKAKVRIYALKYFGAESLLGQARVLEIEGKKDDARKILSTVLAGEAGLVRYDRGEVLEQFARLERDANSPQASAGYYEQAIAAFHDQRDPNHELSERLEYARYLLTTASGVPDFAARAKTQLEASQQEAPSVNAFYAGWRIEYEFGLLESLSNHPAAAIERYKTAVARLDEIRSGLSQEELRQTLFDNEVVQELYGRLTSLLTAASKTPEAWEYVERGKARSFLDMLGSRGGGPPEATPQLKEVTDLEQKITNVRVQLAPENTEVAVRSGHDPVELNAELKQLEQQFALARQGASLGKTRAGQALSLQPLSLVATEKLLPLGTTMLEYELLPDGITAFVITHSGAKQLNWKLDMNAFREEVVEDLRPLFSDASSGTELKRLLAEVSRELINPVAKSLPPENSRLIVVPSGYLNYLPFETLQLPDGRALIDAFTISYLPSASTLQFLTARKISPDRLFLGAIGNVSVQGAVPLPGTLIETDGIAKLEPAAKRASGEDFTHDTARDALLGYDIVHLATHGVIDSSAPLFSALLTSPTAQQPARLSLYEIQGMQLKARLVVLSACQTGVGRLLGGDEVAGFTRTFLLAGADTVVASLWNVSDQSTAELMEGFYRNLRAGELPSTALRTSALALRKKFPHPKYWAAFVVTGTQ
jgi:CHAT domain-containing protein